MMGTGSALMLVLIVIAALLLPQPATRHAALARRAHGRCTRDAVVRVELVCGHKVYWRNPDGSKVSIGSASDLEKTHSHVLMAVR